MKRHWLIVLIFAALLPTIALAGCSKVETASQDQSQHNGRVVVGPPSYSTADLESLNEHSPAPLKIPAYLPDGFQFGNGGPRP